MAMVHLLPDAVPMNDALTAAFKACGIEELGGPSADGWSKAADLQRCAYRYYLRNVLNAVPHDPTNYNLVAPNQNLEVGGLFHAVLAVHYGRRLPAGYPGWRVNMPSPFDFLDQVEKAGASIANVREVRRLYYSYSEYWGPELDLQPVAVEYSAGVSGIHTCRFDMLAVMDGGLWNVEHKSASRPSPDVMESWWLDGEVIGQFWAWELSNLDSVFGRPLTGTKINLTFKSTPVSHTRIEIVQPREVVETFARDRQFWNSIREHYARAGYWPRSLQGCMTRYERCGFWFHCRDLNNDFVQIKAPKVKVES